MIGEVLNEDGTWCVGWWDADGSWLRNGDSSDNDLIQDTAIEFTTWANVYKDMIRLHETELFALEGTNMPVLRAVPLKVRIDGDSVTIVQIMEEK